MQIHVVQPGQTLNGIAQAYGVSVETIPPRTSSMLKIHLWSGKRS